MGTQNLLLLFGLTPQDFREGEQSLDQLQTRLRHNPEVNPEGVGLEGVELEGQVEADREPESLRHQTVLGVESLILLP
jgi:hypothetical protein